jgi:hypothetical protein
MNADILAEANARIDEADIEGFLTFCTEDTVWTFVGDRVLDGKAAVRAWMKETYVHPPLNLDRARISPALSRISHACAICWSHSPRFHSEPP